MERSIAGKQKMMDRDERCAFQLTTNEHSTKLIRSCGKKGLKISMG